jgi:hypothetical protein
MNVCAGQKKRSTHLALYLRDSPAAFWPFEKYNSTVQFVRFVRFCPVSSYAGESESRCQYSVTVSHSEV